MYDAEIEWVLCEDNGILALLENKREYFIELHSLEGMKRFKPLFEDKDSYKHDVECDEFGMSWPCGVSIKNKEVPVLGIPVERSYNGVNITPIISEFYDIEVRHDSWVDKKYDDNVIYFEHEDDYAVYSINKKYFLELPDENEENEFFINMVISWVNLHYDKLIDAFEEGEFYEGFFIKNNGEI